MQTLLTTATVAPPADATEVGVWVDDDTNSFGQATWRTFLGTLRGTERVRVDILGTQGDDGTVSNRVVLVRCEPTPAQLDAAAARQVAADLLAAADETRPARRRGAGVAGRQHHPPVLRRHRRPHNQLPSRYPERSTARRLHRHRMTSGHRPPAVPDCVRRSRSDSSPRLVLRR